MSFWRQLVRGLRALVHPGAADRDVADELHHFLNEAAEDHEARGLSPDAARRAARVEMGSLAAARDEIRASGWERIVTTSAADARYALRGLCRRPGFATIATLTLALGIGATSAIFSAVYPILLAPLPYPDAFRLVLLADVGANGSPVAVTYGSFQEVEARSRSFTALAAADRWKPALVTRDIPERLNGELVTAKYFDVLGVQPAVGRGFGTADDRPDAPRVAIVSNAFARRQFGDPRAALGRSLRLDDNAYEVIGVLPRGFEDVMAPSADVWSPRRYRPTASFDSAEWGHHMRAIGRLAPRVSISEAHRDLAAIGAARLADFVRPPWASMEQGLQVESLQEAITRDARPALLAVLAAVVLVLIVACVNVANLHLARGMERRAELAVRAALGAGRGRIVRQLLVESLVLSFAGGGLGLLLAAAGVPALAALAPAGLPRADAVGAGSVTLATAAMLTVVVGVAVGLFGALQATRGDLQRGTPSGARTTGARRRLRGGLVIVEVALALVLLVGAGLMLRSLARLFDASPGFNPSGVLTMQVEVAGRRYDSDAALRQFFEKTLDAVRGVPGVVDAAFTNQLPLSGDVEGYGVGFEARISRDPNDLENALRYAVTPDWFHAMGIPLVKGRLLEASDRPGAPEAVVISESLAREAFPAGDPIGQRFRAGPEIHDDSRPWDVVVGVVGDVKQTSLALGADNAFYVAMGQWSWVDRVQSLVVRTTGDPAALVPVVKRAVWSVDRTLPLTRIATMDEVLAVSEAQRRFVLLVFEAFGLTALVLAAIGVFGMMSASVAERTRELGVRSALGASRRRLLATTLGQGLALAGTGIGLGLVAAAVASRALTSLLFGVSRFDATTYLGVVATLIGVSVLACWLPAWRASRVDPMHALRAD